MNMLVGVVDSVGNWGIMDPRYIRLARLGPYMAAFFVDTMAIVSTHGWKGGDSPIAPSEVTILLYS